MNLGSLNVSIGADVEPLKRGMATAKQAVLSLADQAKISERHLAALTREMDKEAQAAQRGASATKQLAALDRELRTAKSQLTAVLRGESAAAQQVAQKYDLLTTAQRKQLTSVREQITAQKALQEATLRSAEAAEKAAARPARRPSMQQVGQGITSVGMGLTGAVTAPILAGAAGVLAAGTQLDAAFDKIRIGTGASGAQLTALEGIAKRVGATVPSSFAEVGQAVAELAQRTGLTGQPLEDLARQVLTLSRLTGTDLNENIRQTSRVFADWGIAAKDQGAALDFLFKASQQTGIGVAQLEETLVRSGVPLRQLGLSFGEATALVGKFEKEGVNSQLVLSSLRIELGRLAKSGIKDAHQAFLQIIESIKGAGSASQATAMAVKVFGARAGPDMAGAIREGRFEIEKLWKSIEGGHDSIAKAAKDTDDFGEKFAVLRNRVLVALQPLGSSLMKVLGQMADALIKAAPHLTRLVDWFGKLPGGAQLAVGGFAVFLAGLGPVLVGVGRFIAAWPAMVAGFGAIRTAVLAVNFAVLLNPITLVIAALVALAAAFVTNFGGIRDFFVTGVRTMMGMVRGLSLAEAQRAAVEAGRPNAAQGEIPIGENRGSLNRVKAAQEAAAAKAAAAKAAADRAAAARAAGGGFDFSQLDKDKKSPREKEQIRFTEELTQAHERLKTLLAGEDNIAAQVAARYHLLTQAQRDNLTVVLQQIRDQQVLQQSQTAYTKDMGKLNAEIRRLKAGHDAEASGVDALREKYPGLSNAMLTAMNNAIQWKKHLAELRVEATRVAQAHRAAREQVDQLNQASKLKLAGASPGVIAAAGMKDLDSATRRQVAGAMDFSASTDKLLGDTTRAKEALLSLQIEGQKLADPRFGRMLELKHEMPQAPVSIFKDIVTKEEENQLAGIANRLTLSFHTLSRDTSLARWAAEQGIALESLSEAGQVSLQGWFNLARQIDEVTQRKQALADFAQGIEGIFESAFTNVINGSQGFFSSMVAGFTQMFQQIAAQYLASKLKDVLLNLLGIGIGAGLGGATTGGGMPGGGGGGGLGGQIGSFFGDMSLTGKASGGMVQAARRYVVGEQGPEMFIPRTEGRIVPNSQLAGAGGGGGSVTINFHISTPNAESFRPNQKAMIGDAARQAQAIQRRNG